MSYALLAEIPSKLRLSPGSLHRVIQLDKLSNYDNAVTITQKIRYMRS